MKGAFMRSAWVLVFGFFTAIGFSAHAETPVFWNGLKPSSPQVTFVQELLSTVMEPLAFDESINFQPGLNLYNEAAQLKDLYGTHGSQLCAPIAITHGFTYLRYAAGFTSLMPVADIDHDGTADSYRDKIRYFFQTCGTDRETGTYYQASVNCMKAYVQGSGYKPYVYMVGAHSVEAPPGVALPIMKHVLNVDDIRAYVGHRLMVVMGVGWYQYNAADRTYTRQGGHIFNVYGYDYSQAWGAQRVSLKVVNSWVDYTGRTRETMFDTVEMTKLPQDGTTYPAEAGYELRGNGFGFQQRAFVEDIFVALPQAP